jgi:hypothetical protein
MATNQRHSRSEVEFHYEGFSTPNGTVVPDDIFDVLAPNLTEAELRVLLYIVRRTFGFKKNSDSISLTQMVEGIKTKDGKVLDRGTGMTRRGVMKGCAGLVEKGIITVEKRWTEKGDNEINIYSLRFRGDAGVGNKVSQGVGNNVPQGREQRSLGVGNNVPPQQTVLQQTVIQQYDDDVCAALENFGITKKIAMRLAKNYPAELVLEKLDLVQWLQSTKSSLVSKNPQGFLIKAIEDGYLPQPPKGYKSVSERKEEEEKQRRELEQQRQAQEQFQKAKEQARQRLLEEHPPEAIENTDLTTATAWTKTLEALQQQVSPVTYAGWLKDTLLLRLEQNTAFVLVSSQFARDYLEHRLYQSITRTLGQVLDQPVQVEFVVAEPQEEVS